MPITAYENFYHDDILSPDANGLSPIDKGYTRILFKPGYSVQTRELNQIQSLLQNQIDSLSQNLFKSGKPVVGGETSFDGDLDWIELSVTGNPLFFEDLGEDYKINVVSNSGLSARIVHIEYITTDSVRLFIKYSNSSVVSDSNVSKFAAGTAVIVTNEDTDEALAVSVTAAGEGASARLNAGIFYILGSFVATPIQKKFITVASNTLWDGFVILRVAEGTVDYITDESLLDNSNGTPNFSAIGADRYQIDITLDLIEDEDPNSSYYKLVTVRDGDVILDSSSNDGTALETKLAQRTFEESGDYTLNPFPLSLQEAYNDGENRGKYQSSELVDKGFIDLADAKTKFLINLDPSTAYVKGFRVSLVDRISVRANKARETYKAKNGSYKDAAISASYGNTIDGDIVEGVPYASARNRVYTIYDGATATGTCRIKAIEASPGTSDYRLYLYDISMTGAYIFEDATAIKYIPVDSTFGSLHFTIGAGETLRNTNLNTAIFDLPHSAVNDVDSLQFVERREFTGLVASTSISMSVSGVDFFPNPSDNLLIFIENGSGDIVPYTGSYALGSVTGTSFQITGLTGLDGRKYVVVASVQTESLTPGTKTLVTKTIGTVLANVEHQLAEKHIHRLVSWEPANAVVTLVDDGQRSNTYVNGVVQSNFELTELTYEAFEFSTNSSYFTVNSYLDGRGLGSPVPLAFEEIPDFEETPLYDVLDFRDYGSSAIIPQVDPFNAIEVDLDYYLPRIDKLHVNSNGEFSVSEGVASDDPKEPKTPDDSMALYTLDIPAYTFKLDDIDVQYIDNRRYTMRDIGNLESRISTIEYYTALNQLEKSAEDQAILNPDGISRFKNGFVADAFFGHGVGNVFDPSYKCAVDRTIGTCRPFFKMDMLPLFVSNASSVAASSAFPYSGNHRDIITLPYAEVTTDQEQHLASRFISVTPYEVSTYIGHMTLSPASDNWIDVKRAPDVLTVDETGSYDAIKFLAEEQGVLGTEWNSWQTHWVGVKTRKDLRKKRDWRSKEDVRRKSRIRKVLKQKVRSGTETSLTGKIEEHSMGDRVIDINVRPYIRSRRVWFKVNNLKPNTRVWPFFDGIDVSEYVYQSNLAAWNASNSGTPILDWQTLVSTSSGSQTLTSDSDGVIYGYFNIPSLNQVRFLTGSRVFRLCDSERNIPGEISSLAEATYNASGMLQTKQETIVSTVVPEFTTQPLTQQRTILKNRKFKVKTHISNKGVETRRVTDVVITKKRKTYKPEYQQLSLTDIKIGLKHWTDPIAQSILIKESTGIFATSVQVYFAGKPTGPAGTNANVSLYIVPTENGIPTQQIVPFSWVDLTSAEVITSDDSSIATTFRFDQPVYLGADTEYAIVMLSPDPSYTVYIAERGKFDIKSGKLISSNPFLGSFFTSQNSKTWTPEQNLDLKFTLNRADFDVSSPRTVILDKKITTGLSSIAVDEAGSGYTSVPTVTIDLPQTGLAADRALATATINPDGSIAEIIITRAGNGYEIPPNVTISAPDEPGVTATALASLPEFTACSVNLVQESITLSEYTTVTSTIALENTTSISPGENLDLLNSYVINAGKRCEVNVALDSAISLLTPVLDKQRNGLIVIDNQITTDSATTSKYITRQVDLENPADQVDIYFSMNRQLVSSSLKVWIKLTYSDETVSAWTEIPITNPRVLPTQSNPDQYNEVQFKYESAKDFLGFQVRIDFLGSSKTRVPTIKEFRAIATL